MLVITRKVGESFFIDDETEVIILECSKDKAKIGINAPKNVNILRKELKVTVEQNRQAASQNNGANLKDLVAFLKK
ncbi:MAG: carbon storage regulator CsrA [Oscillospiraceae bacterium]